MNLAVRLYLTNPEQTTLLVQYVFQLARYDKSYDLRDRARLLRNMVGLLYFRRRLKSIDNTLSALPARRQNEQIIGQSKRDILASEASPSAGINFQRLDKFLEYCQYLALCQFQFSDRDQYQLGTLSHYLNQRCQGYVDLPAFPEEATDSELREVEGYGMLEGYRDS